MTEARKQSKPSEGRTADLEALTQQQAAWLLGQRLSWLRDRDEGQAMIATAPSYADVLHRLSLKEDLYGWELLALPGFAEVETDWVMHPRLSYYIDQTPELIALAGDLAESVVPGSRQVATVIVDEIKQHVEEHGVVGSVLPELRSLLWELGMNADIANSFPQ